jgi:hypothetical protein
MESWHITIDQFGYRPNDEKVAVIADPQEGFNKNQRFTPGKVYQIRRVANSEVVYTGCPTVWNGGKTDVLSGDRAWWFDFSAFNEVGEYYIYDLENQVKSYDFVIKENVYERVLYHALRMFYYQREAMAHEPPYAEYPWYDTASWLQDREAHDVFAPDDPTRYRDVSGGWMDAGDTNKYVTFIDNGLHELLAMYEANPVFFKDFSLNIPESHLDAPDILSEIKWELDWCMKMQNEDGSAHIKCGTRSEKPYRGTSMTNRDTFIRYYHGMKSSAAAIALAGVFAHASIVYSAIGIYRDYAKELGERAEKSWQWYRQNPRNDKIDNGEIQAGRANRTFEEQDMAAVASSVYLYILTGKDEYHQYFKDNYALVPPLCEAKNNNTGFFNDASQLGTAFLTYMKLDDADQRIVNELRSKYIELAKTDDLQIKYTFAPDDSAYRAHMAEGMFFWGHLRWRSFAAYDAYILSELNLIPEMSENYKNRAINHLHHIHGVNPFGMTFLSNMYQAGASKSVKYIFHEWFMNIPGVGMACPPGYLAGGPNRFGDNFNRKGLTPPLNQPPMKAYLDAPHYMDEYGAYAFTEPMCAYQCSYVRLCFVG